MMKRLALLASVLLLAAAPLRAFDDEGQAIMVLEKYHPCRIVCDDKDFVARPVVAVFLGDEPPFLAEKPLSYPALKAILGLKKLRVLDLGSHVLNVQDNVVATLAGLPELRELNLARTGVTDEGLKVLADFPKLQVLNLAYTGVTDAGLKELAKLKGLQTLDLSGGMVTDAGLKEVAQLKGLKGLCLGDSTKAFAVMSESKMWIEVQRGLRNPAARDLINLKEWLKQPPFRGKITDAGLKELAGLQELQTLDLTGAQVTDAGLKELAPLKGLQTLNLSFTQTTDAGLKNLAKFKGLEIVQLAGTAVTVAGLKNLAELKGLKKLDLKFTKVWAGGAAELRKALPHCSIESLFVETE
jgi:internalin A